MSAALREIGERAEALVRGPAAPLPPAEAWLGALLRRPVAATLDHTLLKPEAVAADIERLAQAGRACGTATVCVNGAWVALAAAQLAASGVGVAAVVGFPLGAMHARAKASEARRAIDDGATELDMVQPIGLAAAGEWLAVHDDVRAVVEAAGPVPVKVILETAALSPLAIAGSSLAAALAGAAFVKTSTGFHAAGGAAAAAVTLMRRAVGTSVGVKASGGVRTLEEALTMLRAGASRIGTSGGPAIAAAAGATPLGELLAGFTAPDAAPAAGGYA